MAVTIKSAREIELMREAGKILAVVHDEMAKALKPGMSTMDINRVGEQVIRDFGCTPSFLNYNGYPAAVCVSVNNEVVHGIPNRKHRIREGDIVSLDAGVCYHGYHSDAARTLAVGEISREAEQLIDVTRQCFFEGIRYARAGNYLHQISAAVNACADRFHYGVVRELVGHGIGSRVHEGPEIPNFRQRRKGIRLVPGMTLAVEPMINMGKREVEFLEDKWTVVTADGSLSAHYENTILITDGEPEILSMR